MWKTPESSAPAGKRGRQGGGFWARGGEGTRVKAWTLARLTLYTVTERTELRSELPHNCIAEVFKERETHGGRETRGAKLELGRRK